MSGTWTVLQWDLNSLTVYCFCYARCSVYVTEIFFVCKTKRMRKNPFWLWNPQEMSPEIQNRSTNGPKLGHVCPQKTSEKFNTLCIVAISVPKSHHETLPCKARKPIYSNAVPNLFMPTLQNCVRYGYFLISLKSSQTSLRCYSLPDIM